MRRRSFLLGALVSAGAGIVPLAAAEKQKGIVKLPPRELLHVYLLLGQSNMSGRAFAYKEDRLHDERILSFSKEGNWVFASEPLHFDRPGNNGVGPGLSFARAMRDELPEGASIAVIPCAWDGSSLARWEKGGDLYGQCLVRARKAMKDGVLKGILWHQGETDAAQFSSAGTYGERLKRAVVDLRKDLGAGDVPFIAGRLSILIPADRFPAIKMVNEGIDALPKAVKNTDVVGVNGLTTKPDKVNFDTDSARDLGKRYARAMLDLQRKAGLR